MKKPKKSTVSMILWVLLGCVLMWSCERTTQSVAPTEPTAELRIVSLAPNVTEILFAIGAGNDVVGVTKFCNFPASVEALPKVGGLTDPDFERMLVLKPTHIVGVQSQHSDRISKAMEGVDTTWVKVESVDDVYRAIEQIGETTKRPDEAKKLVSELKSDLESTAQNSDKTGIVLFGTNPIIAAGPDTFADTFLRRAGATNALPADAQSYAQLDIEKLISLNPDFIIDATFEGAELSSSVPAVKNGRVHRLPSPDIMRPGPRLPLALKFFREVVQR